MLLNKLKYILVFSLLCSMHVNAQSFYKKYGTQGNDYAESIVMDRDSGYVVVGGTEGIGQGNMDGYFLKLDTAGSLLYTRTFGGGEIDRLTDVKVNPAGFAISGYSNSYGLDYDMFVVQTDELGITTWEKTFGGTSWDFGYSLDILSNGNLIVVGESYSFSNGLSDGYVVCLDVAGDTIWTKHFGGAGKDVFNKVICTSSDNILLIGTITTVDSDTDIWLMYLNANGDEIWSLEYGDALNQEGVSGTILLNDEFVVTGNTDSNSGTLIDNLFFKIKDDGTLNGQNVLNNSQDDFAADVLSYADDSSFVLLGSTNSIGNGGFDGRVFDCGYNTYGNYSFDYQIGNSYNDYINGADSTSDKGLVVVGTTNETDFGYTNIFIHKVDSTVNPLSVYQEEVDLNVEEIESNIASFYPNPAKDILFFKNHEVNGTEVLIYSLEGKLIFQEVVKNQQLIIPADFSKGMYLITVVGKSSKLILD